MRREVYGAWFALLLVACGADTVPEPGEVRTHVGDWRDEVIYQIVVDRFDDAEPNEDVDGVGVVPGELSRHQGGDWAGVTRRLDYLERLGVTALWISPIVRNVARTEEEDGYHGYWASDFTEVNPRFGSLEELETLVDEAHARGMLVILDVVVNHAGRVFAYDFDADGEPDDGELFPPFSGDAPHDAPLLWLEPPTRLWDADDGMPFELGPSHFHRRGMGDLGDPLEKELGDFPTGLRDLATTDDELLGALVETWARWVERTDVDGFRLDAVPHVEPAFWPAFGRALRERLADVGKERFLLLGEIFTGDPARIVRYLGRDSIDAAFDFPFKFQVVDSVLLGGAPPASALEALEGQRALYPTMPQPLGVELSPWQARVAFADNHDTWRLRGELDDPLAAELAMTAVFTVDAIPAVYYGTEQELDGTHHHLSREVLWETGFREDTRMFQHLQRLAELRRRLPALRRGPLVVRWASDAGGRDDAPDAGLLAWERAAEGDRVLVVMNAHALQSSVAAIPTGFAPGTELEDVLWATIDPVRTDDFGRATVRLPPRSAAILRAR